jgi:thymidylate kinase
MIDGGFIPAMKIVLAFEGIDGSGKSSLVRFTRALCEHHGHKFTAVGRSKSAASPLVGRLTQLIQEEMACLTPRADLFVRVARDYQRAYLAAVEPTGVVVLDRFVLSTLALARLRGQEVAPMVEVLKDVAERAHLSATVFVHCPFEVARRRVRKRETGVVPEGHPAEGILRRLPELMEQDFLEGLLTGKRWPVDNSGGLEEAERQVANYLLPLLGPGHTAHGPPHLAADRGASPAGVGLSAGP